VKNPLVHFIEAAREFCRQDAEISQLRRSLKPCEFAERSNPAEPTCRFSDDVESVDWCDPCKERAANKAPYHDALRQRAAAKRRMVRWAKELNIPQPVRLKVAPLGEALR
jgi:hypothetical protein